MLLNFIQILLFVEFLNLQQYLCLEKYIFISKCQRDGIDLLVLYRDFFFDEIIESGISFLLCDLGLFNIVFKYYLELFFSELGYIGL